MAGEGFTMSKQLGANLQKIGADGDLILVDTDQNEGVGNTAYVGLYFSADWCPPCRAFKPHLIEFYKKMKEKDSNLFEIIFVSSDKDNEKFTEYAKSMPWLYLPFAEREKKEALSRKYKVQGIPTLVIVDAKTGKMITDKGRERVPIGKSSEELDAAVKKFPWIPKSIQEVWDGEDATEDEKKSLEKADFDIKKLDGKVVGLYFSAHWCPPCKAFTPKLSTRYQELKDAGKPFEIVFLSSDRSEEEYEGYRKEMPWLALPHNDPRIKSFKSKFDIRGIPSLVIYEKGKVITTEGRSAIMDSPIEDFPYKTKEVNRISSRYVNELNGQKSIVYFTDSEEDAKNGEEAMKTLAQKYFKDGGGDDDDDEQELYFFTGDIHEELCERLWSYLKLEGTPHLAALDLGSGSVCDHKLADDSKISEDSVNDFVQQFIDNKLPVKKL